MPYSEEDLKKQINDFITHHGGSYSSWYVGISENPRRRLFQEHNVDENKDTWIFRQANSHHIARNVERYFVQNLGTDGGTGGGDEDADVVYAYKKNMHTNP